MVRNLHVGFVIQVHQRLVEGYSQVYPSIPARTQAWPKSGQPPRCVHGTCSGSTPAAPSPLPGGATVSIDRGRSLPGRTAAPSVENAPSAGTDAISTPVGFRRVPRVHPLPRRGRALRNPCRDSIERGVRVTDRRVAPKTRRGRSASAGRRRRPDRVWTSRPAASACLSRSSKWIKIRGYEKAGLCASTTSRPRCACCRRAAA